MRILGITDGQTSGAAVIEDGRILAAINEERIARIKHAFFILFQSKLRFADAVKRVEAECGDSPDVVRLLEFLRSTERGFVR